MIEQRKPIDVPHFLSNLEKTGADPDIITCELLSKVYARQANPTAIL